MYKNLIRPLLFSLSAEKAHHFTFSALKLILKIPGIPFFVNSLLEIKHPRLERKVCGLTFKNPVGLAAGFDKNAAMVDEFATLGFGFVEIGTVTPKPQPGNEKPRLFRLLKDEAIINRMGFNNEGVKAAAARLRKVKSKIIIGGNIGKNKITVNEQAVDDYLICFEELYPVVDYFVVNVSSPNTPGLRSLQEKEPLSRLLSILQQKNKKMTAEKPILLKIAPDLNNEQLNDIVDIIKETGISGVIATNTTIDREGLQTPVNDIARIGAGGLSGKPLSKRSTEVIRYLAEKSGGAFPIIAVGGIHSANDALEKLDAGAALVQLYTGFIYEGPALIKEINEAILKRIS